MLVTPHVLAHIIGPGGRGTGADVLTEWGFDPLVIVAVLLPGWLYARGLRRLRERPPILKPWQPYFFYAGLLLVFLALSSPLDALADDLFLMHMVEHLLLLMFVPPLVLLGSPTLPILLGLPRGFRQDVVRPIVRNRPIRAVYRFFTFPLTAWAAFVATSWSWHFVSGAYDLALQHEGVHIFQHVTFLFAGVLLWLTIVDPRPMRSRLSYPLRMLFITATEFQNVLLGVALTLRSDLLYSTYADSPGLWGIGGLDDQQAGGVVMWGVGVMMLLLALVVTGAVWFQKSEAEARRREVAEVTGPLRMRVRTNGYPAGR